MLPKLIMMSQSLIYLSNEVLRLIKKSYNHLINDFHSAVNYFAGFNDKYQG